MTSAASSSNSGSTGGPNRVSTYFVLTFYRNNRVIVTTNAIGAVKSNTQMAVERIMGFTRSHQVSPAPSSMSTLYLHDHRPFDSKCNAEQRLSMQVLICVLFTEMYKLGWKTQGDSSIDTWKRRGNIVFKLSRDPVDTDFACVSVTELNNFITALPNWAETRLIHEITRILQHQFADGPQINAIALSRKEWKIRKSSDKTIVAQRWSLHNYVNFMNRNTPKDFHYVMGFILKIITGMRLSNFHLEASVSVFGDQQDLLIFGYKCRAEYEGVGPTPIWAMTVMRPRQIILVDAPSSVHELLRQETEEEPLWREASYAAEKFWDRKGGTRGKVAFLKLLRRLSLKGHKPFSVYDGLYKNSFFLFTRDPNPDEHLPGPGSAAPLPNILCCSVISDKKIKIDDVHSVEDGASRIQERDARKCLQAIDNSFLAPKRNADDELIRTFEYGLFSCTSAENLAKQMCVFLVLTMEMELIGYEILTAGNISGRFDRDSETRVISPHSWFFVKRGIPASSVLPPAFELCEAAATAASAPSTFDDMLAGTDEAGLPTYDEAMEQAEQDLYK